MLDLISPKSDLLSLYISVANALYTSSNVLSRLSRLPVISKITALHLGIEGIDKFTPAELRRLLCSVPHLQTLSLDHLDLGRRMASVLCGRNDAHADATSISPPTPSTFSSLQALWLGDSNVLDETAFRLLISGHTPNLRQLRLNHCKLGASDPLIHAEDLRNWLSGVVSDLCIIDDDNDGNLIHFP
ncbi:hypothetical protein BDV93DRAFT_609320 [Ceratobasidium sp. AG-I]|nr:hypothetical protein BDV93DRAFT_609320 [Ceratobasidium sp. AG-I]